MACRRDPLKLAEEVVTIDDSLLNRKEMLELLKLYYALLEAVRADAQAILRSLQHATQDDS